MNISRGNPSALGFGGVLKMPRGFPRYFGVSFKQFLEIYGGVLKVHRDGEKVFFYGRISLKYMIDVAFQVHKIFFTPHCRILRNS